MEMHLKTKFEIEGSHMARTTICMAENWPEEEDDPPARNNITKTKWFVPYVQQGKRNALYQTLPFW